MMVRIGPNKQIYPHPQIWSNIKMETDIAKKSYPYTQ